MNQQDQIYIACEAIIGAITLVGNSLVLIAIFKYHRLRTVTNCFIASLALADLLVGIFVAPLAALSYLGLPHNFYGCVFTNSIVIALTVVSVFNLLAVAWERFVAFKYPFVYQKHLTMKRAIIVNVVVWILGILVGLIPLFGWNLRSQMTETWFCNFITVIDMNFVVYFHFFGCIILPLILITGIYSYIFYTVRKQLKQIASLEVMSASTNNQFRTSSRFKKEVKVAKSLAMVIILFAFCWIPIDVINTFSVICGAKCPYPIELSLATIVLSHANSAVNPVIYAYGNNNFKEAFKRMFGWKTEETLTTYTETNFGNTKARSNMANAQAGSNSMGNANAGSNTLDAQQKSITNNGLVSSHNVAFEID